MSREIEKASAILAREIPMFNQQEWETIIKNSYKDGTYFFRNFEGNTSAKEIVEFVFNYAENIRADLAEGETIKELLGGWL